MRFHFYPSASLLQEIEMNMVKHHQQPIKTGLLQLQSIILTLIHISPVSALLGFYEGTVRASMCNNMLRA